MPQICDGVQVEVVLKSDEHKTENVPTFFYRPLNGREFIQMGEVNDRMVKGEMAIAERLNLIYQTAGIGLVGWKHMFNPETGKDFEFDKANLDLFVNPFEVQDLLERVLEAMQPTIEDKKKLDLLPPSEAV
jgi:hypothetical protein